MSVRFLAKIFGLPVALLALGCVPGVSSVLYSGHGGLAWLLLPLCLPFIVVMLASRIWKLPAGERPRAMLMVLAGILLYMLAAYPLGRWGEHHLNSTIGLRLLPGAIFKQATYPLGNLVPPHYTREEMQNPDLYLERHGQR